MDYECKRIGCLSSQLYKHINMPVHVYIYINGATQEPF